VHPPGHQAGQVNLLGQPHHRHQAGTRHQIRVVEHRVHTTATVQQSHLRGVLSIRVYANNTIPEP
jgi:hypothetical protein